MLASNGEQTFSPGKEICLVTSTPVCRHFQCSRTGRARCACVCREWREITRAACGARTRCLGPADRGGEVHAPRGDCVRLARGSRADMRAAVGCSRVEREVHG